MLQGWLGLLGCVAVSKAAIRAKVGVLMGRAAVLQDIKRILREIQSCLPDVDGTKMRILEFRRPAMTGASYLILGTVVRFHIGGLSRTAC